MSEIPDYAWPKEEAARLKAVFNGAGDAHMQRMVIQHIVEILGSVNKVGFDPDNDRMTAFHAGRKWVARQLQNAITLPLDKLVKEEPNEPRTNRVVSTTERANRAAAGNVAKR